VIARLLTAALLVAGCGHEPKSAPRAETRAPTSSPAPHRSPPSADAAPVYGYLSGEDVLGEDELGIVPNVRLGTVKLPPSMDLEAMVNRLRRELPRLRACFRSDVTRRPERPLTLTLTLVIDNEGRVAHVGVEGTDDQPVQQCLYGSLVMGEGFPPAPGRSAEAEASLLVTPVRPAGGGGKR
jgi:hypothetical protein